MISKDELIPLLIVAVIFGAGTTFVAHFFFKFMAASYLLIQTPPTMARPVSVLAATIYMQPGRLIWDLTIATFVISSIFWGATIAGAPTSRSMSTTSSTQRRKPTPSTSSKTGSKTDKSESSSKTKRKREPYHERRERPEPGFSDPEKRGATTVDDLPDIDSLIDELQEDNKE